MKLVSGLLLILFMSGCAMNFNATKPDKVWSDEYGTQEGLQDAGAECMGYTVGVNDAATKEEVQFRADFFENCMADRGFTLK